MVYTEGYTHGLQDSVDIKVCNLA